MNRRLRPYLALLMAAVVALTGHSMAVARGASAPSGEMVLCTGTGPLVVLVDENGDPTGPAHFCPECVMSLVEAIIPDFDMPAQHAAKGKRLGIASPELIANTGKPCPQARGPPVTV